jgi:hypothetical protein
MIVTPFGPGDNPEVQPEQAGEGFSADDADGRRLTGADAPIRRLPSAFICVICGSIISCYTIGNAAALSA